MKKVLMIGNHPRVKGGISTVIVRFLEFEWDESKVKLKFIPTYIDSNLIVQLIFFMKSIFSILVQLIFNRPTVLYIHMSYKGSFYRAWLVSLLAKIFKVEIIIHLHGSEFKEWYDNCSLSNQKMIRRFLLLSRYVIVLGNEWDKKIKKIDSRIKTKIIMNSVEIPKEIIHWNSEISFLYLGVLIKRKNVDKLIEAFKSINNTNVILNIAGHGRDYKDLRKKVINLGLNERIIFHGWIDNKEKIDLIRRSRFLILPSQNEGLPMAILEAISYGLPVLATDVGDIKEAVIPFKNGFIISSDLTDLTSKLNILCEIDEISWTKMSHNSRKIAEIKFSEKNYFSEISKLF